jgi:ABC-type transport system involved in multi-copper enzyme maturation permease subunit
LLTYDLKKTNLYLLCSLPVKRWKIIISKYVIVIIFVAVCAVTFILLGLLMIKLFSPNENILNQLKEGYESLLGGPLVMIAPLSLLYYIVFRSKFSDDTWAFMGKYFLAWLIGAIPIAVIFIFVGLVIFDKPDLTPLAFKIGLPRLIILNFLLLTVCLSVSAWFSIRVFKNKDI